MPAVPPAQLTAADLLERIQRDGVRRTATALRKPPLSSRLLVWQKVAGYLLAMLPSPAAAAG